MKRKPGRPTTYTPARAYLVRWLRANGVTTHGNRGLPVREIARRLGISTRLVNQILAGERWR